MRKATTITRTITNSFSLPSISITAIENFKKTRPISTLFSLAGQFRSQVQRPPQKLTRSLIPRNKRSLKIASSFLAAMVILVLGIFTLKNLYSSNRPQQVKGASSDQRPTINPPLKSTQVNFESTFPLRDDQNNEISSIKYLIEKAEIRDEIIVRGQRARALEGRAFLVLTLKITNNYNQPIEIDTRDYIRLVVNGNQEEKLAPEIHNDPVEVQAISVKYTRLGFTINESDTDLALQIGEINQDKQTVVLNFD